MAEVQKWMHFVSLYTGMCRPMVMRKADCSGVSFDYCESRRICEAGRGGGGGAGNGPPLHMPRCCLVQVYLTKLASKTGVGFQLCQPQNLIHFLSHGKYFFKWSKTDGTQLSNAVRMRPQSVLDQRETGTVTTRRYLAQRLIPAYISEMFITI